MKITQARKKDHQPKRRMSDVAYEKLKQAIITAQMPPGSPINEQDVMDDIGVGRTPLREALQRLVQDDLVLSVPQRGYFVSQTSNSDFFQLREFRTECELMAISLAAKRISDTQLREIEQLIEEAIAGVEQGDKSISWHLGIDEQLHMLIAKASGNEFLERTLHRLFALSLRSLYVSGIDVTLLDEEICAYKTIYNALAAHSPEQAVAAMIGHLELSAIENSRKAVNGEYSMYLQGDGS